MKRVFLIVLDSVGMGEMPENMEMQEVTRFLQFLRVRIFPCQI